MQTLILQQVYAMMVSYCCQVSSRHLPIHVTLFQYSLKHSFSHSCYKHMHRYWKNTVVVFFVRRCENNWVCAKCRQICGWNLSCLFPRTRSHWETSDCSLLFTDRQITTQSAMKVNTAKFMKSLQIDLKPFGK